MPRVTAAHEQQVRERIVAAALRVFATQGFHRATIQDVVRESGLSVGAIYTYFKGKDELFLAGCDLTAGQGIGELAARLAGVRTTAEKLAIGVAFFVDSTLDAPAGFDSTSYLVQAWAEAEQEPAVREMLARRRERLVTLSRMLLAEGVVRGELPAWLDVEGAAAGASALMDGLILQRIEEGAAFRREEAERRARAILELALAATAAPERPSLPVVPPQPFVIPALVARGRGEAAS
jgi:AcrR family transcriptional regulator